MVKWFFGLFYIAPSQTNKKKLINGRNEIN